MVIKACFGFITSNAGVPSRERERYAAPSNPVVVIFGNNKLPPERVSLHTLSWIVRTRGQRARVSHLYFAYFYPLFIITYVRKFRQ